MTKYDGQHTDLTYRIIGCAQRVHAELRSGYPEAIYHRAMTYELVAEKIPFQTEQPVAVCYRGQPCGEFRLDLLVDEKVVVELKALDDFCDAHIGQVISYLKATQLDVALLLNFGTTSLQTKRIVRSSCRRPQIADYYR